MSIQIKEPLLRSVIDERLGMIVFNHAGSSAHEDTGRDAQILADHFSLQVLAVDRPGSACWPSRSLATELYKDYVNALTDMGKRLDHEADQRNFNRIIIAGRSAGGLGALALACTEQLSSVSYIYAAEPVGWSTISISDGQTHFRNYLKIQKQLLADDHEELVHPEPTDLQGAAKLQRLLKIPVLFWIDQLHNQAVWSQPIAYECATKVASELTELDTTIAFAAHSLVASQGIIDTQKDRLPRLRKDGQPFVVEQIHGTVHASFDRRSFFAQQLSPVVSRALLAS